MRDLSVTPADQVGALVNHRYRSTTAYPIDRATIREFARAVQDYHPAHWSADAAAELGFAGLLAPATLSSMILNRVQREILDTLITGYSATRILHADQVLDLGRPLVAGDRLSCDIYFESFRHFADYDVLAIKSVLIDQHGETVQTGSTALLARTGLAESVQGCSPIRPGPVPGNLVPAAAARVAPPCATRMPCTAIDFETLAVGTELPSYTVHLSRGDVMNYAKVVGDAESATYDERTATGLPSVVAPGMLKLGLAASFLSCWLGDPSAVSRFRAQFAHFAHSLRVPTRATSAIEFHGRISALDPRRRRATIAIDARSDGRKLFGYAAAEVRFPVAG
ncbi:fused (3R)-hydroxyacyl-ACP dehydratase subunits HadA/HadB [Nocardia suismassiliense]|uniref:fused (3R)-hydroxyacyl-ACP dehydratase subunits HadA/HadB n=1 Tax=Nocardia suismassiliense TaxID=2077092 RepID=UPI00131F0B37|nr:fused (3R)-hydroxyacyl-ACP dehydratase subunits HadA/HadB [Nocardia suismassiliense]